MDFENIRFCQFRPAILFAGTIPNVGLAAKNAESMEVVFGGRNNFEIFEPVIVRDAVDVVNLEARRDALNEGLPHQPVSLNGLHRATVTQAVADITFTAYARLKDKTGACVRTLLDALNAPKVGNLINTFIAKSRHPKFLH